MEYIVLAEYHGRTKRIGAVYNDRDEAVEVAQNFLWDTELSRPDVIEDLVVMIAPLDGFDADMSAAEPVEI